MTASSYGARRFEKCITSARSGASTRTHLGKKLALASQARARNLGAEIHYIRRLDNYFITISMPPAIAHLKSATASRKARM